jgi:Asp/Glu/hydantoin racemase
MKDRLVFIHTVAPLVELFSRKCKDQLPGVEIFHILDEPLLEQVRAHGKIEPEDIYRLQTHIKTAEEIKAKLVIVTCSTLSPAVGLVHAVIPIIRIDEVMAVQAVAAGNRIGVVATNPSTLEPTRKLLLTQAAILDKLVDIQMVLAEGAFKALMDGDTDSHDRIVRQAMMDLSNKVDVIVLAQASMARVVETISRSESKLIILTSPDSALEKARNSLSSAAHTADCR